MVPSPLDSLHGGGGGVTLIPWKLRVSSKPSKTKAGLTVSHLLPGPLGATQKGLPKVPGIYP